MNDQNNTMNDQTNTQTGTVYRPTADNVISVMDGDIFIAKMRGAPQCEIDGMVARRDLVVEAFRIMDEALG